MHAPLDGLKTQDGTYRTITLIESKRYIWFFGDAQHFLETARNCIYHFGSCIGTRFMWKEGKFLVWDHLLKILDDELENGLKLNSKLTLRHI